MLLPNKITDLHTSLLTIVIISFFLELCFMLKLLSYKICAVAFLYAKLLDVYGQIANMLEYYLIHSLRITFVLDNLIIVYNYYNEIKEEKSSQI